jgi:hypothetical protein
VPGCFGVDPHSYHGVCPPCKHGSPARGVYSYLSRVALTVHAFPVVVHIPFAQMVHFLESYG